MIAIRLSSTEGLLQFHGKSRPKKKLKTTDSHEAATSRKTANDFWDWRGHFKFVRDMHLHALKEGLLTDIAFVVGEEKAVYRAHRVMLAFGSAVFEAMFFGALSEKGDSISIPDVEPKAFEYLLRFLYCGDVVFDDDITALKTFFAAEKYCVINLKDQCEDHLLHCTLKASNVWLFLESSIFLNCQNIMDRCLAFLRVSTRVALEDDSFLDTTFKTLETFLSMDALNVSEMKILLHVVHWAQHKSQSDPDTSFHNYLMRVLKLVRFYNLSYQDFVLFLELPEVKDMLSDSDSLAILKHIIWPSVCALPKWCCTKVRDVTSYSSEQVKRKWEKFQKRKTYIVSTLNVDCSETDNSSSSVSSSLPPDPED